MDPGTVALVLGGTRIVFDVWKEWRNGRKQKQGIILDANGNSLQIPTTYQGFTVEDFDFLHHDEYAAQPIQIQGKFVADVDFIEFTEIFLDDEDKRVIMLILDAETDYVYIYEFEFDGFEIDLWPGLYSFYVLIIDPFEDEVIGIGYPDFGDDEDPNPIQLSGVGLLEGDFVIYDTDELL